MEQDVPFGLLLSLDWRMSVALENSNMRRYNPESFYRLGKSMAPIIAIDQNAASHSIVTDMLLVKYMIETVTNEVNVSKGCKQAAAELEGYLNHYANAMSNSVKTGQPFNMEKHQIEGIEDAAKKLELLLLGDCQSIDLFYTPPVQAYSTQKLIEEGECLLPPAMAKKLKTYDTALADTRQAAKCLAFELWTASGFHIARATESLLQKYYEKVSGTTLPERITWVQLCLLMLGKGKDGKPVPKLGDQVLIGEVQFVGANYRNPLIHPENDLDENEGPLLMAACVGVMSKILKVLP